LTRTWHLSRPGDDPMKQVHQGGPLFFWSENRPLFHP
jgi:hypothetical protein